ncbi:hypothetical protein GGX14DRAFT_402568 [Mycena pura]|uniref:Uncharacterized protein n=1 Tax=Mycena pura TaxID=153505 RepID=A0AAD6V225_9AGAR|nr:hypothetical protein GGX14DRAFT_409238 [Mycena pura]KAJ7197621.1 hypothetical protein GGX14DRAFT_402546 [Mycena pura]KAJ7197643.1 hypothetical protein GGX14DRAFT_402563 [Mycena pura]KAJ7197650.1 hypothetical protein GGX14DRAFT_402568 [Mycena pura]
MRPRQGKVALPPDPILGPHRSKDNILHNFWGDLDSYWALVKAKGRNSVCYVNQSQYWGDLDSIEISDREDGHPPKANHFQHSHATPSRATASSGRSAPHLATVGAGTHRRCATFLRKTTVSGYPPQCLTTLQPREAGLFENAEIWCQKETRRLLHYAPGKRFSRNTKTRHEASESKAFIISVLSSHLMDNRFTVDLDRQLSRLASVLRLTRLDSISPDRTQVVITVAHGPVNLAPLLDHNAVDSMPASTPPPHHIHHTRTGFVVREVVGLDEIVGDMVRVRGGIIVPTVIFHTTRVSEPPIVHRCTWACVFESPVVAAVAGIVLGFVLNQVEITLLSIMLILKTRMFDTCSWGCVFGSLVVGAVVGVTLVNVLLSVDFA